MKDAKQEVITRLLEMARVIRKRQSPEHAAAVLPYEQQLERDLAARTAELDKATQPTQPMQEAA
jgi:hypothetical protein